MSLADAQATDVGVGLRATAARHGRRLQYVTIVWNSAECVVALVAGFLAGSIALVGFGFDSAIEVTSSFAALWRLRWDADEARREAAERRTLGVIGSCFLLLAAYVLDRTRPDYASAFHPSRFEDPAYQRVLASLDPKSGQL